MKHRRELGSEQLGRLALFGKQGAFRRSWRVLLPIALLLAGGLVAAYLIATRPVMAPKPISERTWTVSALPAEPGDIRPLRKFYGVVVAPREVEIRPEVSGIVRSTGPNFVEGGIVRAGDLLVDIDPFDYDTQLRETEADIRGTRGMIERGDERIDLLRRDVERREKLQV